jgi:hypothetical protein
MEKYYGLIWLGIAGLCIYFHPVFCLVVALIIYLVVLTGREPKNQ